MKTKRLTHIILLLLLGWCTSTQAQEEAIWDQPDTEVKKGTLAFANQTTLHYKIGKRYAGYNHYQTAVTVELVKNKIVLDTKELHNGISDGWPVLSKKGNTIHLQLTYFIAPSDQPTYKQLCWLLKKNRLLPCP